MVSVMNYKAGSCNIGEAEIKQRRRIGYVGLSLTLVSIIFYLGLVYLTELDKDGNPISFWPED